MDTYLESPNNSLNSNKRFVLSSDPDESLSEGGDYLITVNFKISDDDIR